MVSIQTGTTMSSLDISTREHIHDQEHVMYAIQDLDFTFHRAFDMVRSQQDALEALVSCGVRRVLTSGSAQTALQVTLTP